jgi:hypothetical protein
LSLLTGASLSLAGCSGSVAFKANSSGSSLASSTGPVTPLSVTNPPPNDPICTPFDNTTGSSKNKVSAQNGLSATLTYIPSSYITKTTVLSTQSFIPGMPNVVKVPNPVILNQLDIFTQDFTLGFPTASGTLDDLNGNELDQYFSLQIPGSIMLNSGDTAGNYQFMLLSDDGATMSLVNSAGTLVPFINDDGTHSNQLGCETSTVPLQVNQPLNFQVNWYQGPADRLGLVLLWRKGASVNLAQSSNCGMAQDDAYYFTSDPTTDLPVATSNWTNMVAQGGWSVVPASNFYLPAGTTNPCN